MANRPDSTPSIGSCTEVDIVSVVAGCIYFWLSIAVEVDSTGGHTYGWPSEGDPEGNP